MKKLALVMMLGVAVAAVAAVNPLTWKATTLELGSLPVGESVALKFEFTNTSQEAVRILEAKGSCGCTEVKVTKNEVAPGETSEITAVFVAKSAGAFKKSIEVKTSLSDEPTRLYFSGVAE